MKKTLKLFGITALVVVLVTGCGKVPKLENGQDAVVKVKNGDISVDKLYDEMKDKYALSVLIDMIDKQILNEEYKDNKEIDKDVDSQISLFLAQTENSEEKLLEAAKENWGVNSMAELKEFIKTSLLRNKAISDYAKSIVTDKEIEKYYDENIFADITAKHILITSDANTKSTDAEKQEAEEKALNTAKEVIKKLKNGEDWDKLAKEYSQDESNKDKGGLLPEFVHGDMVKDFEVAAKNLKKGEYTTTPVKTTYGYHIIYKVDQKEEKPKLEVVKDDIIQTLANEKLTNDSTLQITAMEKLREKYDVKIQDSYLKTQYETYLTNAKNNLSK